MMEAVVKSHLAGTVPAPIVVPSRITLESAESRLARRFARPSLREDVVYEFTDDKALLHQYYLMRGETYRRVHPTNIFEAQDEHDRMSHVLIARVGKLCVGGCRLTVREAGDEFPLPLESDEYRLKALFPHYALENVAHGEFSRFAVLEAYRDRKVMETLSALIMQKAVQLGLRFGFARFSSLQARDWCRIVAELGCSARMIDKGIPSAADCPEIQMNLTLTELPVEQLNFFTPFLVKYEPATLMGM